MQAQQLELDFGSEINYLTIDKKIRLITTFSGVGSQEMAFERLSKSFPIDWEIYKAVEFDKYAIASYNAIHNTNFPVLDITKVHADDFEIKDKDKYFYMFFYSFPCFTGDTFILTSDGLKQIKDVKVGDYVLTHDNSYQKVLAQKLTKKNAELLKIKTAGCNELKCTPNHKFLIRSVITKCIKTNGIRHNVRTLTQPSWKAASDIKRWDYVGFPINQNSIMPDWNGYNYKHGFWKEEKKSNFIKSLLEKEEFWWIVGRYIADGWILNDLSVVFSVRTEKLPYFISKLNELGFKYSIKETERSAQKIYISNKELVMFLKEYGKGAYNKHIANYVFDMPVNYIKAFISGYESGDGWIDKRGRHISNSVSKELVYGLQQLIHKAYKRPAQISYNEKDLILKINGHDCHSHSIYTLTWNPVSKKTEQSIFSDGQIWQPVKEIISLEKKEDVYDIEVEKNHSFTANGIIAHNCTDLSVAGKQLGMKEGSGTRSSLLFEVKRILNEMGNNLPDLLIMENVTQVHGAKNKADFDSWCEFLRSKNYSNFYHDMNSKFYGVAQNRDRCFMVSMLGNHSFEFPKPMELKKIMADYLEPEVDEKFYINNEKAESLIQQLIKDKKLPEVS